MYAVIDVETTGLKPHQEKLTEIAIVLTDGYSIEKEWHTLINPEKTIPAQITRLTGITNSMVEDAPKFYEIAREIVLMTEGRVFVAHNVSFDYNFIRAEFKRLGYDFRRKKDCTVQLSRRIFPGQPSYSLGKLCRSLGIENTARHRAAGDAIATAQLLQKLLQTEISLFDKNHNPRYLPPGMEKEHFDQIPEKTGVYYFYDEKDRIIYIGKSLNIKQRVKSHFNSDEEKEQRIKNQTGNIDYQVTGSELIALLLESEEIKKYKPIFNRRQRRKSFNYGLFSHYNEKGYLCLYTQRLNGANQEPYTTFSTAREAKEHLRAGVMKYFLCQKLSGLYTSDGACFHYQVHQCLGACIDKEVPDTYNLRVKELLKNYDIQHKNHLIIDRGRNSSEYSFVLIRNGKYHGFGFIDRDERIDENNIWQLISYHEDNRDVRQIIRTWLNQNKPIQIKAL